VKPNFLCLPLLTILVVIYFILFYCTTEKENVRWQWYIVYMHCMPDLCGYFCWWASASFLVGCVGCGCGWSRGCGLCPN